MEGQALGEQEEQSLKLQSRFGGASGVAKKTTTCDWPHRSSTNGRSGDQVSPRESVEEGQQSRGDRSGGMAENWDEDV